MGILFSVMTVLNPFLLSTHQKIKGLGAGVLYRLMEIREDEKKKNHKVPQ